MLTTEQTNIILSVIPKAKPEYLKGDSPFVRVGYWNRIYKPELDKINAQLVQLADKRMWLEEIDMYDDDCGRLFCYGIRFFS